jgi:VanZ family protein
MHIIRLLVCLAYLALLTVLLLTPNPAAVVGLTRVPWFPWGNVGIHFCAFSLLTILVHATRWPKPLYWLLIVLLLMYAGTTESLQHFVPSRSVELKDYLENFLGIAAGTATYWFALRIWQAQCSKKNLRQEYEYN